MNPKIVMLSVLLIGAILTITSMSMVFFEDAEATPDYSTPNYKAPTFKTTEPAAQDWDPTTSFVVNISSMQIQGVSDTGPFNDDSHATITLVVGQSSKSEESVTFEQNQVSWDGPVLNIGAVNLNWQVLKVSSKVMKMNFELSSTGPVDVDKVLVKIKARGLNTNTNVVNELERTFTFNIAGAGTSHGINTVSTGGSVYIYPADDVETFVMDSANQSKGQISSAVSGQLVRISPFPSTNGMISSVSVKDSSNNVLDVTTKSHIETTGLTAPEYWYYFFTMPDSDVTVTVEFNSHQLSLVSDHGSVSKKLVRNFLGPVKELNDMSGGAGYQVNSFQVKRSGDYYFNQDVIELTPTPEEGYVFKQWNVTSGGVTVGSDNRFTMGDTAVTIEAVFEKVQDQPQVPEASSMTCSGIKDGSNIVLSIQIDGKGDVTSMQDPRLFITVKYGNQGSKVINYYSKPVLTNGSGSDVAIFSAEGLNQVVVQLVDGVTNGLPASYVCWCHYEPATA
ncbi:hypothetical protein PED39_01975 [Methanomassiliicoccales archaeon LGM-RCC1]|nr:hypothetical protein PED39_01975 [Methanomassiliicoccales archaeon LGM-RCC1]